MAAVITGIDTGVNTGVVTGVNPSGSGPVADTDATSGKYVPSTTAQFTALGLAAPVSIHLCQESSGSLADSVGSLILAPTGSPTYQQAVSGWTRKGVGLTQAANQRFGAAATIGPNPGTTSTLWLVYATVTTPGGNRDLFGMNISGASNLKVQVSSTPRVRALVNAVPVTGASDPTAAGLQPMLLKHDRTAGVATLYTGQEKIAATYSASVIDGIKGFGTSGGTTAPAIIAYSAVWSGASAEISDATAKTWLQALGFTIPWS